MEFFLLLGILVLCVGIAFWFGRRRQPDHRSPKNAEISAALMAQRRAVEEKAAKNGGGNGGF
jgi:hypothetical protein